jgi:Flp pilus assembly protein TadD
MKQPPRFGIWSLIVGLLVPVAAQSSRCDHPVARLVALQGELEEQERGVSDWRRARLDHRFCPGDRIRTRENSRATVELNDKTYLSLEQKTTIVFSGLKPREPSWLDLIKGIIYLRSRTPSSLDIKTPFVNAAIKGTEFLVASGEQQGQVSVFEGRVEAYNAQGRVSLTDGQSAVAEAGQAPVRKLLIDPTDAVRWALHYPPLLDATALQQSPDADLRRAAGRYLAGDAPGALRVLESTDAPLVKAALLLELGRADEASVLLDALAPSDPRQAEAPPLRAVIALARNDRDRALALAKQATQAQPQSAAGWTALSYAQQARFRLDDALTSAHQAAERAPTDARALARLAELNAALGRTGEARALATRAVTLNPRLARAWIVRGFTELNEGSAGQAEVTFGQALRLDSADPLGHFGLGLSRIRQGQLDAGTAALEIAASLDPNEALARSYLGKAYYELKNSKVAETELDIAKKLDPQDPTPYFYAAIKNLTENRPVKALENLQESIALNDNRAVYRSRQMLDKDEASRSASLARVYETLHFGQRARLEAWKSLDHDPRNFSAHRFLADSYASQARSDVARVSELLQSQLLQPINIAPLQPTLAETNLAILQGAGPSNPSFHEFNPLFTRNGVGLLANALWGTNGTVGDDVTLSGINGPFSGSAGQFHYSSNGIRPNNDLEHNIYNVFGQWAVTPDLDIQAELRSRRTEAGDLTLSATEPPNPDVRNHLSQDSARFGGHYKLSPSQNLLASVVFHETEYRRNQFFSGFCVSDEIPCPDGDFQPSGFDRRKERASGYSVEGQHILSQPGFRTITGLGYVDNGFTLAYRSDDVFEPRFRIKDDSRQFNGYLYVPTQLGDRATMTLGLSYEDFDESGFSHGQVNPKFGFIWSPFTHTTLRAAAFRVMKRAFVSNQTIEPTQLAGFNQFFDDPDGSDSTRYGFGVDQKLGKNWFGGIELTWRRVKHVSRSECPEDGCDGVSPRWIRQTKQDKQNEEAHRAYLYWTPTEEVALAAEYRYEGFDRERLKDPRELTTHFIPLTVSYFHPSGPFLTAKATYIRQSVDSAAGSNHRSSEVTTDLEHFWTTDISVGYRLPRRLGLVSLNVLNILDEDFRYQGSINPEQPWQTPLFQPGRSIFARVNLWFF